MSVVTLDQVIDTVMQLPLEQQEMLVEIIRRRHVEKRRREIALDAEKSIAAFRAGILRPQSLESIIAELRESLEEEE
jgi:hypothetical protein